MKDGQVTPDGRSRVDGTNPVNVFKIAVRVVRDGLRHGQAFIQAFGEVVILTRGGVGLVAVS